MSNEFKGIAASDGIVIGKVYLFEKTQVDISTEKISDENKDLEIKKAKEAIDKYIDVLKNRKTSSETEEAVRDAHVELASDPALLDEISNKINGENYNSSHALKETIDQMAMVFEMMDDEYLSERAADYRDIGENIQYRLLGIEPKSLEKLDDKYIIISEELTPTDTSTMDKQNVLGMAMDLGGKTSHSSIIAQTLGIPAIVGMKDITSKLKHGELIVLDANLGVIIQNPDEELVNSYEEKIKVQEEERKISEEYRFKEAVTKDGKNLDVVCNIGNIEDLKLGLENGAEGVGLFRTEFVYMEGNDFPSEEKQYEVYKEAAELLPDGQPLIIRTLDIGGDKGLDYFEFPQEENPFLGWRALRIQFDMVDILKSQFRAILRASAHGNVKFLLPMIISVDEIKLAQKYIEECKEELKAENIEFDSNIEVGVMIETPASAIMSDRLIKHCDFFSIGTNDLTQYTLAVDRGNEKISHLYNYFNPAVLRAIKQVIDASHKEGKWTGMCGAMSSDEKATYLLLGLGLDEYSVVSSKIGKIKHILSNSNYEEAKELAEKALECDGVKEVLELYS